MVRKGVRSHQLGLMRFVVLSIGVACGLNSCTTANEPVGVAGGMSGSVGDGGTTEGAASTQGLVDGNGGATIAAGSGDVAAGTGSSAGGTAGRAGGTGGKSGTETGGKGGMAASVNCASLPKLPIAKYTKLAVPGSEDFTFDNLGYLVGADVNTNALVRTKYRGTEEIISPGIGSSVAGGSLVRGLRFVAGANSNTGELIFADAAASGLFKVNMKTKVRTALASGVNQPNGLALDRNGFAYLTGVDGNVLRVDTKTGKSSIFFAQVEADVSLDGIAFSPDYQRLYINTEYGKLYYVPVNSDGTAGNQVVMAEFFLEQPEARMPVTVAPLDGMTVDECGNIYVVNMFGTIWRVSPDSLMEKPKIEKVFTIEAQDTDGGTAGTGGRFEFVFNAVNFGSGVGGWKSNAIYIMSMAGNAYEVVVGVNGAKQLHL